MFAPALLPLVAAFSLGAPPPPLAVDAVEGYVTADVLRVRGAPAISAPTLGRLAITARVRILERQELWTKVAADGLEGWVAALHLGATKLSHLDAVKGLKGAKGLERIDWLDRRVALAPSDVAGWHLLLDAAIAAKQKEKERLARDVVQGRSTIYVAGCERLLLGVRSDGSVVEVERQGSGRPPGEEELEATGIAGLGRIASSLAETPWWPLVGKPVSRPLAREPVVGVGSCFRGWSAEVRLPGPRCDAARLPRTEELLASWFPGTDEPARPDDYSPEPPPDDDQIRRALDRSSLSPGTFGPLEALGDLPLWVLPYSCSSANEAADGPTYDGWAIIRQDELDQGRRLQLVSEPGDRAEAGAPVWFRFGRAHVGLRPWRYEKIRSTPEWKPVKERAAGYWYFVVGSAGIRSGTIVVAREGGSGC